MDVARLEHYCLNTAHPRGRHKARLFRKYLDIGREDAAWLRQQLLRTVSQSTTQEMARDEFGQRWRVDIPLTRQNYHVVVRTAWIVSKEDDRPRFLSCWVLE